MLLQSFGHRHMANTMSNALSQARGESLDDRCTELGEGRGADYKHQMVEYSASDQHTYADHIARIVEKCIKATHAMTSFDSRYNQHTSSTSPEKDRSTDVMFCLWL